MGKKNKPKFRLTLSRKDKELITFEDYKGEEVERKHRPIGAIFEGEDDDGNPRYFAICDGAFKFDPDTYYLNVFVNDDEDRPAKKQDNAKTKTKVKKQKREESEEDSDEEFGF